MTGHSNGAYPTPPIPAALFDAGRLIYGCTLTLGPEELFHVKAWHEPERGGWFAALFQAQDIDALDVLGVRAFVASLQTPAPDCANAVASALYQALTLSVNATATTPLPTNAEAARHAARRLVEGTDA